MRMGGLHMAWCKPMSAILNETEMGIALCPWDILYRTTNTVLRS